MIRTITLIACVALAVGLAVAQDSSHKTESAGVANESNMFSTNRCFSKGGLGIVNKSLYIVVKSASNGRNELIVKPTEKAESRWKGRSVSQSEVVVLYEGKIWSADNLPSGFDLSKCAVISFESDKVRFFDFQAMLGGYYERIKVNDRE